MRLRIKNEIAVHQIAFRCSSLGFGEGITGLFRGIGVCPPGECRVRPDYAIGVQLISAMQQQIERRRVMLVRKPVPHAVSNVRVETVFFALMSVAGNISDANIRTHVRRNGIPFVAEQVIGIGVFRQIKIVTPDNVVFGFRKPDRSQSLPAHWS